MDKRILFVDDEANVLAGIRRHLEGCFNMDTASSGVEGLKALAKNGAYAVVVSDMRMPQMDGIEFLARAREMAPNAVRIMLTGNADLQTAMNAVNEGRIFRFLTKPCPIETLTTAIEAGIEYNRLVTAEAQLLEKTLVGSVSVLTEILCFNDPDAFNRAKQLREHVRAVAGPLGYQDKWQLELAALLSQIGQLTLPTELKMKCHDPSGLSGKELAVLARVPEIGRNLLAKIPRLEVVSEIVLYQDKQFNGAGFPENSLTGQAIPLGARILKILSDLIELESQGMARSVVLRVMRGRIGWYDEAVLETICSHFIPPLSILTLKEKEEAPVRTRRATQKQLASLGKIEEVDKGLPIAFVDLLAGDVLMADVKSMENLLLLPGGSTVTEAMLESLRNYAGLKGIREPIYVQVEAA